MNSNAQLIETLTHSEVYRDYERAYTETTGLPVTLRPLETWQLPLHGKRGENAFCALIANKSRTCATCLQMQEKLAQGATNEPCTITCAYGLCETAVPVKIGSQTVGLLQTGQVMRQKPTEASFQRAVSRAAKLGLDIDNDETREAYLEVPVVAKRRLDSITRLLAIFAEHLSLQSNRIAMQQATAEPPVIAKAKKFIEENQAEQLSLRQVATTVNTSVFYFCKLFRKVTGMTFTEFVSRTRVEKSRNLLLNPNLRISEIAFAVGFQSLTHFNRTFKSILGLTPTEYREQLPRT